MSDLPVTWDKCQEKKNIYTLYLCVFVRIYAYLFKKRVFLEMLRNDIAEIVLNAG